MSNKVIVAWVYILLCTFTTATDHTSSDLHHTLYKIPLFSTLLSRMTPTQMHAGRPSAPSPTSHVPAVNGKVGSREVGQPWHLDESLYVMPISKSSDSLIFGEWDINRLFRAVACMVFIFHLIGMLDSKEPLPEPKKYEYDYGDQTKND